MTSARHDPLHQCPGIGKHIHTIRRREEMHCAGEGSAARGVILDAVVADITQIELHRLATAAGINDLRLILKNDDCVWSRGPGPADRDRYLPPPGGGIGMPDGETLLAQGDLLLTTAARSFGDDQWDAALR